MLHNGKLKKRRSSRTLKFRVPSTFINANSARNPLSARVKQKLHSKSTYFYRWNSKISYVVPSVCGLALVLVLGIATFPTIDGNATSAYAESNNGSGIAPMSVDQEGHISLELLGAADQVTTATADQVSYRINQFNVKYAQTSQYAVQVNSMNGYGSSLFGQQNPTAEIKPVGTDKTPEQFGNNTWGYAIGEGVSDGTNLTYNTVPEYNTQTTPLIKYICPKKDESGNEVTPCDSIMDTEQTDSYTLAFAAKIGSDSPADHYTSRVYLSVVRTPGRIYTVTYNANKPKGAEGDVTGTPGEVKFVDTGNSEEIFKLSTDVLKLKKYKFLGWTTDPDNSIFAKDQKDQAAVAVQYPAGSAITFPSATETTVALYAVWLAGGGSLLDIDTMQEMSVAVCNSEDTKIGDTKRLQDTRDGNYYWVAKLKDGNCWMTQNLDYNIPADRVLHAADTNVASDTTLPGVTAVNNSTSNGVEAWAMTDEKNQQNKGHNILAYYDPGLMLKKDPATTNNCNKSNGSDVYNIYKLNDSRCISQGWLDVSTGYTPKTTAPQGDSASATSATNSVLSGTTYDAHYLSGNYYSWALATANSAWSATAGGTQASSSVCPKGWKLPTSSTSLSQYPTLTAGSLDSFNVSGSFAYMFRQYGLATAANAGNVSAGSYNVYDAPLYYLRSGMIYNQYGYSSYNVPRAGMILHAGERGFYWSSVVGDNDGAYHLSFTYGSSSLTPSNSITRYKGLTIRCVHDPSIAEAD